MLSTMHVTWSTHINRTDNVHCPQLENYCSIIHNCCKGTYKEWVQQASHKL